MDYTQPKSHFFNPVAPYTAIGYPLPKLTNSQRLGRGGWRTLLRDGKIYLSLADAVTLAVENNFDIEIARINLDIADTDILRTKAGATLRVCVDRTGDGDDWRDADRGYGGRWTGWNDDGDGRRRYGLLQAWF